MAISVDAIFMLLFLFGGLAAAVSMHRRANRLEDELRQLRLERDELVARAQGISARADKLSYLLKEKEELPPVTKGSYR